MLPPISEIFNADICRDGGSRFFCFYSDDDKWYEFHIRVRFTDDEVSGYHPPRLYLESVNDRNVVHEFTWKEARRYISALEYDNVRFRELVEVVKNGGKLLRSRNDESNY